MDLLSSETYGLWDTVDKKKERKPPADHHSVVLQKNLPVMLLRNISPQEGLCNGTRMIVNKISQFLLHCTIASGTSTPDSGLLWVTVFLAGPNANSPVLIPRLDLRPDERQSGIPIKWIRRQFPIHPAFAMTINKSQGQTLQMVKFFISQLL